MINNILPTDVELYILELLIMPLDIKTLKKVSKKMKNRGWRNRAAHNGK